MAELRPFNLPGAFQAGRQNALSAQQQRQQIAAEKQQAPVRNQLQQLGLQQAQQNFQQQQAVGQRAQRDDEQSQALRRAQILNQSAQALLNIDPSQRAQAMQSLGPQLQQFDIDVSQFPQQPSDQDLQRVIASTQGIINNPEMLSRLQQGLKLDIQQQNIDQRERFFEQKPVQAGEIEREKLGAQKITKAEIAGQVATAKLNAKAEADAIKTGKSNNTALNVYETAMKGLVEALGGTITGPGTGHLPALTENAQIAEGAVAAMAPVLKQIFRLAGEGTFTDNDQLLLMQMIPTRSDHPKTITSKMANIDAIVRAKFQQVQAPQQAAPAQQQNSFTSSGGIQFTVQ